MGDGGQGSATVPRMPLSPGPIVLAHPLTQRHELPVSPLVVASVAALVLVAAAYVTWRRAPAREQPVAREHREPGGVWLVIGRAVGLGVLVLSIVAGLFGHESSVRNITPALVIGAGWPLLVLASAVFGRLWPWIDPFDTLARALSPLGAGDGEAGDNPPVSWAVVPAAALVAYLTMWPNNLVPRSVSLALLAYTVVTLAGCLAVGRRRWLVRAEIFGLFSNWIAAARHPTRWTAAPGAHLVVAVLAGGFTYGLLRDSELLLALGFGPRATLYSGLALAASVAVTAGLAETSFRRESQRGTGPSVSLALTIASAGIALALALARNRFTTSVQLLPYLARDPLGTATDPLAAGPPLNGRPLGIAGLLVLQVVILVVAHGLAAGAASWRAPRATHGGATPPALLVLSALVFVGTAAVTATAAGG